MDDAKGLWVEKLSSTLWAIKITIHSGTRDTPFNLAFRSDTVILVEIGINTFLVKHFDPKENQTGIRANLDLLEEVKEDASLKAVKRQRQLTQYSIKGLKLKGLKREI